MTYGKVLELVAISNGECNWCRGSIDMDAKWCCLDCRDQWQKKFKSSDEKIYTKIDPKICTITFEGDFQQNKFSAIFDTNASIWNVECTKTNILDAAIEILEQAPSSTHVIIVVEEQWLFLGMTKWIFNWRKNGWKTKKDTDVKNQKNWEKLYSLSKHMTWKMRP